MCKLIKYREAADVTIRCRFANSEDVKVVMKINIKVKGGVPEW